MPRLDSELEGGCRFGCNILTLDNLEVSDIILQTILD